MFQNLLLFKELFIKKNNLVNNFYFLFDFDIDININKHIHMNSYL